MGSVPAGLGRGRTSEQGNLILFALDGPCEHNHFLHIWKLWPPRWHLLSDTQEVGLDLCMLTGRGAD